MKKKIFITGGSGCIGHYIAEALINETEHELYFLVRNPDKVKFNYNARTGINILQGDLQEIEKFKDILKTINVAILAAACWGGSSEAREINVNKTIALVKFLDVNICEQVIYFSTESILNRQNELLKEAGEIGTDYIKTKYQCYNQLSQQEIAPKITTVFPTLVFGGDDNKPYSHLSAGFSNVLKWADLIRWFKADGSFHFIHGRDIAQVIKYLVENPNHNLSRRIILGNQALTANQAVEEVCQYLGKPILFRIPLSLWLANFFIKTFNIKMAAWDRFCLNYRHFTHENPVNPSSLGLKSYYPTVTDIIKDLV